MSFAGGVRNRWVSTKTSAQPASASGSQSSAKSSWVRSIPVAHEVAAANWWKNVWYFIGSPDTHRGTIGTSNFALTASAWWNARSGLSRPGFAYAGVSRAGPVRKRTTSTSALDPDSNQAVSGASGASTRRQTRARTSVSRMPSTRTTGTHAHAQRCSPTDALAR